MAVQSPINEPDYFGAVIVEPRRHPALKFVIRNVLDHTPYGTKVIWFYGTKNGEWAQQIQRELCHDDRLFLRSCGKENLLLKDYNALLTSASFWESIPFKKILIFQTDSMILAQDRNAVLPFLKYTYIGAPCWRMGRLMNGGFSIRDKAYCLDVVQHTKKMSGNEDVKFISQLYKKNFSYVIPSDADAQKFSVEQLYYPNPFGCHKPWRYMKPMEWKALTTKFPELHTLHRLQMPKKTGTHKLRPQRTVGSSISRRKYKKIRVSRSGPQRTKRK